MTSHKMQFLDPVGVACKLSLLKFSEKGTKIRIYNHTIQLVEDNYAERIFIRPFYKDSRDDISILYLTIVRFVELYLMKNKDIDESKNDDILDDNNDTNSVTDEKYYDNCHSCMKKLAQYMIEGISELQYTYGYCNASLTLQLYSNILQAGIDETYTRDMLPVCMRDIINDGLIDVSKIKKLWKEDIIIKVVNLFENCFNEYSNKEDTLLKSYKIAIEKLIQSRDKEFKNVMNWT